MKPIHAIYENGVFRPTEPVELPEHTEVNVEPRTTKNDREEEGELDELYAILSERYRSGETDLAARHNEHQP